MFLISHRGNLFGPNKERENSPSYILEALQLNFDVEVDVWYIDNNFWLGHDAPQYKTDSSFLLNSRLWCHAKNLEALYEMKRFGIHCFWHENDFATLTSKNYIWTYPGVNCKNSIIVLPEIHNFTVLVEHLGICSDFIESYKKF